MSNEFDFYHVHDYNTTNKRTVWLNILVNFGVLQARSGLPDVIPCVAISSKSFEYPIFCSTVHSISSTWRNVESSWRRTGSASLRRYWTNNWMWRVSFSKRKLRPLPEVLDKQMVRPSNIHKEKAL